MPDEFALSRRKALAALGTIGVASVGAGLGTSAFFSDRESFENNQLTAGTLDLKVGWTEQYSDWSEDEAQHAHMENGDLVIDDRQGFMNATLQEQFPDEETRRFLNQGTVAPCEAFADVPDDLSKPVIDLTDVKPGDFGEVTFEFVPCTNPGYVWLNGGLVSAREGGVTEPEGDAAAEDGDADATDPAAVELLDEIEVLVWYDRNCNNRIDGQECDVEVGDSTPFVVTGNVDNDDSIENVRVSQSRGVGDAEEIAADEIEVGIDDMTTPNVVTNEAGNLPSIDNDDEEKEVIVLSKQLGVGGIRTDVLDGDDDPDVIWAGIDECDDPETMRVVVSDQVTTTEKNSEQPQEKEVTIYTKGKVDDAVGPENIDSADDEDESGPNEPDETDWDIKWVGIPEKTSFRGTLREALAVLDSDRGIPLDADPTTIYDEVDDGLPADGDDPDRECFPPETRHCLGFRWELPRDAGNAVQSDAGAFDLGFYAEQCRRNDGSGQASETGG